MEFDALLLAALRRTLHQCGELAGDDPQLRALLARALDQHEQLTGHAGGCPEPEPIPGAGRPAATGARFLVTITNGAQQQQSVEESYIAAQCAVDGVALAAGLTTGECGCGHDHPHGTLVDGRGVPRMLFDIQRRDSN